MLSVAGRLAPEGGGAPVWPELPDEVLKANPAFLDDNPEKTKGWYPSPPEKRDVRSIFLVQKRTVRVPLMETFDLRENAVSCARRNVSTVAPQALTLLNDPVFFECAQALGKRIAQDTASLDDKIRSAFQVCLARAPSDAELNRLRQFHARQTELLTKNPQSSARIAGETDAANLEEKAVFAALCRVIMNLDEFVTRE